MATVTELKTKMKTVNIKGKDYVEVNERVKYFRANYPEWSLITEILKLENGFCLIKASVIDENDNIRSTGHAYEMEGSTFINKTSFIENCETSAIGRALGNFGIGIDSSIASAEEVNNAILNQTLGTTDKVTCPKCGKPTMKGAIDKWGMCADCKKNCVILPPTQAGE